MINDYKTTSDLPKAEDENMVEVRESELNNIAKTAFVIGMLCGIAATALLMMVVEIVKAIFS